MKMVEIAEQNIESGIRFDSHQVSCWGKRVNVPKHVEVTEFESVKVPETMPDESLDMMLENVKNPWFDENLRKEVQAKVDKVFSDPVKLAKYARSVAEDKNPFENVNQSHIDNVDKHEIVRYICDDVTEDMVRKAFKL